MVKDLDDVVVRTVSRIFVPFIQIYGLYVFVHGHGSPGGGFQGGCIMAASFILLSVAYDLREVKRRLSERKNAILCALGVFIYAGTGYLAMLYSGNFLDYGALSNLLPGDPVKARYYGMAMIELGVQITVMAVMVSIFLDLVTMGKHEDVPEDEGNA
jgi:multicomponent Na+:H+ antiporter subunit B